MPNRVSLEKREKAWELYNSGKSIKQVASDLQVSYSTAYFLTLARQHGFSSSRAYLEARVSQNGFCSVAQYKHHLDSVRRRKENYSQFGKLVCDRLQKQGTTQDSLARQLGVSHTAVYLYCKGLAMPTRRRLIQLIELLDIDRSTIESLLS